MKTKILIIVTFIGTTIIASTQTAFDDFERTGGLGSNWTIYFGSGSVNIVSDSDLGFSNGPDRFGIAAWTASSFSADQYSEAVISPERIDSMLTQVFVRRRVGDGARYGFHWNDQYGGRWELKYDGLPTPQVRILNSLSALEPLAGDTIRLEVEGMTLRGYHNGNLVISATDTAFISSNPITTTGEAGMAYRFTVTYPASYPQKVFEEWNAGNLFISSIQNNVGINSSISIYPNPFSTQTTLLFNKPLQQATLSLSNSWGQIVTQIKNLNGPTITLSSYGLPAGIYFARIEETDQLIALEKVVIAY